MSNSTELAEQRRTSQVADTRLLERIEQQDQSALNTLFAQYRTVVFRFLIRLMRNEALAEEITNEVFLEVWRFAGRYEGRSTVKTWLLSIARNRAISAMRKRTEEAWDGEAEQISDETDDPEVTAQKSDKSAIMRSCLSKLSANHTEVIDLVYYHEMSISEVSQVLGISEATVKTRMFYARKKLSEVLKAHGVDRGWP